MKSSGLTFNLSLIVLCSTLALLVCFHLSSQRLAASTTALQEQSKAAPPTTVEGVIAEIVKARGYTSGMVVLANKNFTTGSEKYNRAFTLYAQAYGDYTAWAAYLTAALRAGHTKHLNNNQEYNQVATTASASGSAFTNYVVTNTPGAGESHAIVTILSGLADLGIKLWTDISKQVTLQRNNAATSFCESTKWQTWQELTDQQAPKQTADYCKLPTDSTKDSTKDSTGSSPSQQNKAKNAKQTPNQN
jgi:hypothetical protein